MANDKLIIIPTYNESETIKDLVSAIFRVYRDTDVLVVDDNSPDGTGRIIDGLAASDRRLKCIHRPGKEGMGTAYVEGFRAALGGNYRYIAQMDADFSHDPSYLPRLFASIKDCDVVIGSRYAAGGGVKDWGAARRLMSRFGSLYAKTILGINVNDLTGGFKCFRREALESIDIDSIKSKGYAFQIETTYRAFRKGFRIKEIPIVFTDRRAGLTKMSSTIFFEAIVNVWKFRMAR